MDQQQVVVWGYLGVRKRSTVWWRCRGGGWFRSLRAGGGVMVVLLLASVAGCANSVSRAKIDYETVKPDQPRDESLAQRENTAAVALIQKQQYQQAEEAIKRALAADVMYGPAHNNLGKVYYHQSKYYLAAWEFQYAMKLMPNLPEPPNNLGLVYEQVGKLVEAQALFEKALGLQPDNPVYMGHLARVRIRRGDRDPALRKLLSQIVATDTRPTWVAWAREQLDQMGGQVSGP